MINSGIHSAILFAVFYFLFDCSVVQAQNTFNTTIDFDSNYEAASSIFIDSNYFYIIGSGYVVDNNYWVGLFFCKTDFQGNVLWRKTYTAGATSLYPSYNAISTKNGLIYIAGTHVIETFGERNVFLCGIDPLTGDTTKYLEFIEPGIEEAYRLAWMPDSTILIYGATAVDDYLKLLLMKVDTNGNILYSTYYGEGLVEDTYFFQLDDNGDIYLAYGNKECDPSGYYFYSVNQDGSLHTTFHSDINCMEWGAPSLTDNGFYVAGYEYYTYLYTFFAKLDSDYNYIWKNYFSPDYTYYLWSQYELQDGSVIVYGSKRYNGIIPVDHAFLRKIDKTGNTVWEREYYTQEEMYYSYIWDIDETPDGSLVCVGQGNGEPILESGYLSENVWLLKLDSLGCLDGNCDSNIIVQTGAQIHQDAISVYPNPIVEQGTILIDLDKIDLSGISYLEIEICDLYGHILHEFTVDAFHWNINGNKILIPVTNNFYSDGVYFAQVKAQKIIIGSVKIVFY